MNSDILRKQNNIHTLKIFLIIIVMLLLLSFIIPEMLGTTGKSFIDNKNSIYESVYLEIDSKPIEFSTYNDGKIRKFYIVSSGDNYFLARIPDKQYKIILDEYEKNKNSFRFTLEGRSNSIFSNLKESAKKALNEASGSSVITDDNFYDYFGNSYIDTGDNIKGLIRSMCFGLGVIFGVIEIIAIITYIYGINTYKKVMAEYGKEELVKELDDENTIALPKAGIYLTKKYVISNSTGFKVVNYKDILWVYVLKQRNSGILIASHLMFYLKNGKGYTLATMRKPEDLENLIPEIVNKNNKILVGYTHSNQKKYNEIIKKSRKQL